jgi:hypothetical protein
MVTTRSMAKLGFVDVSSVKPVKPEPTVKLEPQLTPQPIEEKPRIGYKLVFVEPKSIKRGNEINNIFGIAKLEIPSDSKTNLSRNVENTKYAKYRADSVKILKIKSMTGKTIYGRGYSVLKAGGYYYSDKYIHSDRWNNDLNAVCTNGIHFYLSKRAVYSLYQKLTFKDILPCLGERINKQSIPNSIYVSSDDDGKILYKLYYDHIGKLVKLKYPEQSGYFTFNQNFNLVKMK